MSKFHVRGASRPALLLLLMVLPLAAAPPAGDPSALPSESMPRASKSLLLDVVKSSAGYFAVGERGHVLKSGDGKSWTQAPTPTRSTLTTITTVGYGDKYPVTSEGRIIAVVLMISGVGLFGALSGIVASGLASKKRTVKVGSFS